MKKFEHHTRYYIQRAINTSHWISQNRNAFLTCQQVFGQYMDLETDPDCFCDVDDSPEAEAFRASQPAMALMFDLLCSISRDDFDPDQRNKEFDGVVRQPNMLPNYEPSVLIPLDEEEEE